MTFCILLHHILQNMKIYLKSGDTFSKALKTTTGVLQGDVLSPSLFNIFTSDLPSQLNHEGIYLDSLRLNYIMYADDLCLIANNAADLQLALVNLETYCDSNNLTVNIKKSKLVIFHKGRLPKCEILYKQEVLERVNEFTYLGITLSSQMSFTSHMQTTVLKANSRIGLLYSKLDLQKMPIEVVMKVFACYVLPLFEYGLPIWISGKFSSSAEQLVNSTFTKFLKRYMNVPKFTHNALVYFLTNTQPLMALLKELSHRRTNSIYLPNCMEGIQLSFFNNLASNCEVSGEKENGNFWSSIPSHFLRSRSILRLPSNQKFRRMICREDCDSEHHVHCQTLTVHNSFSPDCVCKYCGDNLHAYHITYKVCDALF